MDSGYEIIAATPYYSSLDTQLVYLDVLITYDKDWKLKTRSAEGVEGIFCKLKNCTQNSLRELECIINYPDIDSGSNQIIQEHLRSKRLLEKVYKLN